MALTRGDRRRSTAFRDGRAARSTVGVGIRRRLWQGPCRTSEGFNCFGDAVVPQVAQQIRATPNKTVTQTRQKDVDTAGRGWAPGDTICL